MSSHSYSRRDVLQVGCSSLLGLGLGDLQAASSRPRRAKSVVLVFLTGGASHIDTFDPKPQAIDIRGEFKPIHTKIPGVQFTEHVPRLADRADRFTIVRSMAHRDNRHLSGTHNTLTGAIQTFRGNANEDKELDRRDWPSYGATLSYLGTSSNDVPSQITLPNPLIEGPLTWPGQHAGFLGAKFDPLIVKDDPNRSEFRVSGLALQDELSISRLDDRKDLLRRLNQLNRQMDSMSKTRQLSDERSAAYNLLTSPKLAQAFDISSESGASRDRYGRSTLGQTLLLARRLVEAEVPVIQCNMGIVQSWDTHSDNFPRLKNRLLPGLDQGASALIDDLHHRGLMNQTLVIIVGEFGRTPRISTLPNAKSVGRDHWAWCYTALMSGAGVQGGQLIGKSDRIGAYPMTTPFHPNDLGATIYDALGVDPETVVHDQFDRPIRLNQGKVMNVLYDGRKSGSLS